MDASLCLELGSKEEDYRHVLVATAADAADLFSLKSTTFEDGNPLHHTVRLNS